MSEHGWVMLLQIRYILLESSTTQVQLDQDLVELRFQFEWPNQIWGSSGKAPIRVIFIDVGFVIVYPSFVGDHRQPKAAGTTVPAGGLEFSHFVQDDPEFLNHCLFVWVGHCWLGFLEGFSDDSLHDDVVFLRFGVLKY
jgi:hypothetical protein